MNTHIPVMVEECLKALNIKKNGIYIDATLGRAGHSIEILNKIPDGFLYCFDKDQEAIKESQQKLSLISNNFKLLNSDYKDIDLVDKKVDGILFDLGVSSPQLDDKERGFSFHGENVLDMRMDQKQTKSAKDVVNNYSENQLIEIFFEYGNEKFSKSIARNIVERRKIKEIKTTKDLVNIIKDSKPQKFLKTIKHPARQIFQALRIEVNDEIKNLKESLDKAIKLLNPNGIIAVLTYHSLEDRTVKEFFYENKEPKHEFIESKFRTKKTKYPSKEEVQRNIRSRTAKLRVLVKKGV